MSATSQVRRAAVTRVVVVGHHLEKDTSHQVAELRATMGVWEALARRGISVTRVCPSTRTSNNEDFDHLSRDRLSIRTAPLRPSRPPIIARFPNISRLLGAEDPDVVHVVGEPWQSGAISAVRAACAAGTRVGIHFAENGPGLNGVQGVLRKARGAGSMSRVDYAIGWSSTAAALAKDVWGCSAPVAHFPGIGVPKAFFASPKKLPHGRPPTIAFVGRLAPEKGVADFIEIARVLAATKLEAIVAGSGAMEKLVADADRLGVVRYLGQVSRTQLPSIYSQATLTVVPSISSFMKGPAGLRIPIAEQFGRVIIESLASGTPVVAYSTGGIPEAIGPGGITVPERDTEALMEAIGTLLNDPELYETKAAAGRAWAENFSDDVIADRLLGLWASL